MAIFDDYGYILAIVVFIIIRIVRKFNKSMNPEKQGRQTREERPERKPKPTNTIKDILKELADEAKGEIERQTRPSQSRQEPVPVHVKSSKKKKKDKKPKPFLEVESTIDRHARHLHSSIDEKMASRRLKIEDEHEHPLGDDVDWRKAVIYSEIFKPKY